MVAAVSPATRKEVERRVGELREIVEGAEPVLTSLSVMRGMVQYKLSVLSDLLASESAGITDQRSPGAGAIN